MGYEWTASRSRSCRRATWRRSSSPSRSSSSFCSRRSVRELGHPVHGDPVRAARAPGRALAQRFRGLANDIYSQIGLVMLIGLASKNAILIVEFARRRREEGLTIAQSAMEASRVRLRPILMTSFAFILGVLPLTIATGAGAAAAIRSAPRYSAAWSSRPSSTSSWCRCFTSPSNGSASASARRGRGTGRPAPPHPPRAGTAPDRRGQPRPSPACVHGTAVRRPASCAKLCTISTPTSTPFILQ